MQICYLPLSRRVIPEIDFEFKKRRVVGESNQIDHLNPEQTDHLFSRWFLQTDYFCFEIQGTAVCLTGPFPVQGKVFSISD
jgi:hypothetical protein